MLELIFTFVSVMAASFIGSINGLGVTFIISIFLLIIDKSNHQSHAWIPYLSTCIISLIFISTRLRIVFKNIAPIIYLCIFSSAGLLMGKVFKENPNLLGLKMIFGAFIIVITFYLNKYNYFSRLNINFINDELWSFTNTDNFMILLIGFVGGLFDFSLAVLIYSYLIYNKEEYNVEHLDVCVYSCLALTSFINFIFIIFTKDISSPDYFNSSFLLALLIGAICSRTIYHLITLEYKRKFLIYALYTLGFKLFILNFMLEKIF